MAQRPSVLDSLHNIAAPMVNQSDLPFRLLAHRHGATLAYTQMLLPARLLADTDYLHHHLRDLQRGRVADPCAPVVVQLAGDDPEMLVRAAREVVPWCDGIDLNLGCPLDHARENHYGAYLLSRKDWPAVEAVVSSLHAALPVPISAKLRLCSPAAQTLQLSARLQHAGASFLALHARHPSARRRRAGPADLAQVRALVDSTELTIPVVGNGNVRVRADVQANRATTGAAGIMVGETLLADPCIFEWESRTPLAISTEYLGLCAAHPGVASLPAIRAHIRHFVEREYARAPWSKAFRAGLGACADEEDVALFVATDVRRWTGGVEDGDREEEQEGEEDSLGHSA